MKKESKESVTYNEASNTCRPAENKTQCVYLEETSTGVVYSDKELPLNRTYKSRLFEMIFSSKKELLELYNAVNGTWYDDPEKLTINTLENAIYMSMRNDLSFLIDSRLALYEHQSTYNPNLPLRYLMYISNIYSKMIKDFNLYGSKPIKLPTPCFVIFYNGLSEQPDRQILKLSDIYEMQDKEVFLELKAIMLNINAGHNKRLMEQCKTLRDYSIYVDKVRGYAKVMGLEEAVERSIKECIESDVLAEFLRNNRTEAKSVSIFEYDEEKHMRQTREEGRLEGRQEIILELLSEYGEVPQELENIIRDQEDYEILKRWNRLAAQAVSVEEFEKEVYKYLADIRENSGEKNR